MKVTSLENLLALLDQAVSANKEFCVEYDGEHLTCVEIAVRRHATEQKYDHYEFWLNQCTYAGVEILNGRPRSGKPRSGSFWMQGVWSVSKAEQLTPLASISEQDEDYVMC
jgi:hypothetical protein